MPCPPDPADARHCPLCGAPSLCAAEVARAAGTAPPDCWCFHLPAVDAAALARIPAAARGRACLCARCAAGASMIDVPLNSP
ncbi:cysteine-rich CWC family protein [Xylophilus sp. ASV27]|uniref:cysteine-rich CWC family protein n=1 Tax=Xylophilus sp. ASV27 TaxID=2795129 RepID=UPI0018ED0671|nr:cysteine-rich CWC family protein [Xylophilus sp. ASV27]